ncbi:protein FAM136A-like [Drosophila miranda]|uniref:protein FAM136A-like n=1 Tax=Drosophila miranda TaxID=7229 RepID=UPI00143F064B|nr:protein FAM136A-like [Drosophila miranda]
MVEQQRKRLEVALSDMIEDMYRTHLRRMQSKMHRCAARCCDDEHGTLESVQNCIEKCAGPLMDAQDYLQHELGQFQNRLQNCVKDCNSDVRSRLPNNPNDKDMSRSQHLFEHCTGNCVDKYINLLPGLLKSIRQTLDRGPPNRSNLTARSQDA